VVAESSCDELRAQRNARAGRDRSGAPRWPWQDAELSSAGHAGGSQVTCPCPCCPLSLSAASSIQLRSAETTAHAQWYRRSIVVSGTELLDARAGAVVSALHRCLDDWVWGGSLSRHRQCAEGPLVACVTQLGRA